MIFVCPPVAPTAGGMAGANIAHSLRLVLPKMTAPASRSFCATKESLDGRDPSNAANRGRVHLVSGINIVFDQDRNTMQGTREPSLLPLLDRGFRG